VCAFITLSVALFRPSYSPFSYAQNPTFALFPGVRDQVALNYLIPTFGAQSGLSPKTTPIMHQDDRANASIQTKVYTKPPPKTNQQPTHPLKPYPPSSKDLNIQPSVTSPNSSYTNQPQCPLQQWVPARIVEVPVQPKPMEVTCINHP
jgi:hypothetical protein